MSNKVKDFVLLCGLMFIATFLVELLRETYPKAFDAVAAGAVVYILYQVIFSIVDFLHTKLILKRLDSYDDDAKVEMTVNRRKEGGEEVITVTYIIKKSNEGQSHVTYN